MVPRASLERAASVGQGAPAASEPGRGLAAVLTGVTGVDGVTAFEDVPEPCDDGGTAVAGVVGAVVKGDVADGAEGSSADVSVVDGGVGGSAVEGGTGVGNACDVGGGRVSVAAPVTDDRAAPPPADGGRSARST